MLICIDSAWHLGLFRSCTLNEKTGEDCNFRDEPNHCKNRSPVSDDMRKLYSSMSVRHSKLDCRRVQGPEAKMINCFRFDFVWYILYGRHFCTNAPPAGACL